MRTRSVCNVLLAVLFISFLSSMVVLNGISSLGVSLPAWMGVENDSSSLEGRDYQSFPELSVERVVEGDFQAEFEQWSADGVLAKDASLLMNAAIQRVGIKSANAIFQFDAYPTFYGSDIAYSPSYDALYTIPDRASANRVSEYAKAAALYNDFAERNDQVNVYFCRPMRANALSFGPVADLTSNRVDYDYQTEYFDEQLSSDIALIDINPDSYDDYVVKWFRSDHHWNMEGSYEAYVIIASQLGFSEELVSAGDLIEYKTPAFYGSYARTGLFFNLEPDYVVDYEFNLPEYDVEANGETSSMEALFGFDEYERGEWSNNLFRSRHAEYFRSDYAELIYTNPESKNNASLLLVTDSFAKSNDRLLAAHYGKVYVFDPRRNETTLDEYLQEHSEIEDVVFCLSSTFAGAGVMAALGDEASDPASAVIE